MAMGGVLAILLFAFAGSVGAATTWTVDSTSATTTCVAVTDTTCNSIQSAIAAATDGDTINVAAGTYTEVGQIIIGKNLSIVGADKNTTIIKPSANTSGVSDDTAAWILVQSGKEFNLSNVTLDGDSPTRLVNWGLTTYGTGIIDNVIVKNIKYATYAGRGIVIFGNIIISNSRFENIQRIGVHVRGAYSGPAIGSATITNSTFVGKGNGDFLDYGIEVGAGASATITGNTISGARGIAATDGSDSAGILVTDYYGTGTTATVTGNVITNNSTGLYVGYSNTDASVVTASQNSFSGNTYAVQSTNPTVNAANNWWGAVSGPTNATTSPTGTGDGITDNILFTPWYIDSSKTTLSNAVVMPDVSGNVTVTEANKDVVVASSTQALTIDLGNVAGAEINFDSLIDDGTGSGIIPETTITSGIAEVKIPADTTVTAVGWNGVMQAPTAGDSSGTAPASFSVGNTVIEMGSPDFTLTFNKAVKITLPGVTGRVGYRPAGSTEWQLITTQCASETDPGITSGECYVAAGGNTVIWTYHFTTFGGLEPISVARSGGRSGNRVSPTLPTQASPVAVGRVLGAATGPEGTNLDSPAVVAIKAQIAGLIAQLIGLLREQLATAIAAGLR